ncbi:MAG: helix-turn-helix domain-containing protein [Anaerorhabdus sp.]
MFSVGEWLRILRKIRGLKQMEVANYCGISAKAISRYERNEVEPELLTVMKLTCAYGIDLNTIIICDNFIKYDQFTFEKLLVRRLNDDKYKDKKLKQKIVDYLMEDSEEYYGF